MLWPATVEGTMPHDDSSSASAYSTANSAGWASPVLSIEEDAEGAEDAEALSAEVAAALSAGAAEASGNNTDRRGRGNSLANAAAQRSSAARNVGCVS